MKKNVYWIAGTTALLGVVAFFVYDYTKSKKQSYTASGSDDYSEADTASATTTVPSTASNNVVSSGPASFPLKKGVIGYQVTELQRYLNRKRGAGLVDDGIFGNNTYNAVRSWQSDPLAFDLMQYKTFQNGFFNSEYTPIVIGEVSKDLYNATVSK